MTALAQRRHLCQRHRHQWPSRAEAQVCCTPGWEQVFELPQWCTGYEWYADVILYRDGMICGYARSIGLPQRA